MSVTQISDAITTAGSIKSGGASNTQRSNLSVDTETFLTLLVAQLQYQDPLSPQSDTEFLTQLAQMSSLQEMQQLNSGMSSMQAYSLVGKYAYAEKTDPDTGRTNYYYGTISSVFTSGGSYYATIGEAVVGLDEIAQVFDPNLLTTDTALVESSNLIGKTVNGVCEDEDGATVSAGGVVTAVACEEGRIYAVVDNVAIPVECITDISDAADEVIS
ncbi:MAG: flagellar hook assembly protein FlgD [Oscillospiraceae bacterium]|jgi:flagellar basal-body rod modification protein FlgD